MPQPIAVLSTNHPRNVSRQTRQPTLPPYCAESAHFLKLPKGAWTSLSLSTSTIRAAKWKPRPLGARIPLQDCVILPSKLRCSLRSALLGCSQPPAKAQPNFNISGVIADCEIGIASDTTAFDFELLGIWDPPPRLLLFHP